jgi:hypothetical protein
MNTAYNVEPAEVDIIIYKDNEMDMSFEMDLNGVNESLTGSQLDMTIARMDGTVIKELSSAGEGPEITISDDSFNFKTAPLVTAETLKYYILRTIGTDVFTMMTGKMIVKG